ncbi:hypothetical protein [Halobacterium yunchengense]|uniref:hypothetical protein n=1 Tax=Halobacterium yunchengense TaxID=3108497 RepID=UPI0030088E27
MSTQDASLAGRLDEAVRDAGSRLVAARPEFEAALLRARDLYARGFVAARVAANRVRFDAPVRPYRLLDVDPHDVEYVREFEGPKFRHAGLVAGGDWDRTDLRFEEMDVYRAYERHFEDGVPWEETAFFDRVVAEVESGREKWGCASRAAFERRCRRLDDLYEDIATEGFRTQAELREAGDATIKGPASLKTERYKDEIAVHVDRNGEFLFEDGRNRLSIAKLLDLDSVPVRVLRRHADWQRLRDAYVAGDERVRGWGDHPDLAGLAFGSKS